MSIAISTICVIVIVQLVEKRDFLDTSEFWGMGIQNCILVPGDLGVSIPGSWGSHWGIHSLLKCALVLICSCYITKDMYVTGHHRPNSFYSNRCIVKVGKQRV